MIIILLLFIVICLAMTRPVIYTEHLTQPREQIPDVKYHEDPEKLKQETMIKVKNKWGRLIDMPWSTAVTTTPFYNPPNSFKFGPTSYVPNYTESIMLSRGWTGRRPHTQ